MANIINKQVVALLLVFFSSFVYCEDSNRRGEFWLNLKGNEKTIYIAGLADGTFTTNIEISGNTSLYEKKFSNVTTRQLSDGLDAFYADYRNRSIQVFTALIIVMDSINGYPQSKIEKETEDFRKLSR